MSGELSIRGVSKRYGDLVAVDDVSADIAPGEFVTFLGPSGSGKTTTLNIVAGFTAADAGGVLLDGVELSRLPPHKRDIGMVFQSYALFPHLTAAQNVAFPLQVRGTPQDVARRKVREVLELVRLEAHANRRPAQLSGGQQQRVALARAIVYSPRLLLMDEPLGALDRKLREALQLEILRISEQLGVTVVYVTHDQEEALVMSDRIAVYADGRIQQMGSAAELYERPRSRFVADFIGESNIFPGTLAGDALRTAHGSLRLLPGQGVAAGLGAAAGAALVVRPERLRLTPAGEEPSPGEDVNVLTGVLRNAIYLGSEHRFVVDLDDGRTVACKVGADRAHGAVAAGTRVDVAWSVQDAVLVPDPGATAIDDSAAEPRRNAA